jgi:hypothetical protein
MVIVRSIPLWPLPAPFEPRMPSLFRFLTVVAVIGGVIYGAIFALANFVGPKTREMTVTIPADRFQKR